MVFDRLISLFKKKKAYLYKDCYDLPIKNFDVAYKTGDLKYLVVGYDGYRDVKVPEGAEERWTAIFDEWVKLSDSNEMIYYYQLVSEVAYLEMRYYVVKVLLLQIYERDMDEKTLDMYIEMLKGFKYHYNKENDKLDELTRLFNQHQASENKLGIKKSELEHMQEEHQYDEAQTLEQQAVVLEQITGRNNIDVYTTVVAKWIEIGKLATSINAQRKKTYGRK